MSNAWRGGSTRRWRRIRAAVLVRDSVRGVPMCQVRLPGVCTVVATCVHHVKGRAVTGDDPRWLVAACDECNLAVGEPATRTPQPKKVTKW
jgi:5-methylcytosine-specific restriction endonuclease McrA